MYQIEAYFYLILRRDIMDISRLIRRMPAVLLVLLISSAAVFAGPQAEGGSQDVLMQRIEDGKTIRIGFANEVPWAYPGDNQDPLGFVNQITLDILESMGYTNIEPVVTEWGGLIPGLKANRFDIITGGMYILPSRAENINFSEPIGVFGESFIVPAGNPEGIESYDDIRESGVTMVTGSGYSSVEHAKTVGIPDENVITVPGNSEILAAVRSGRAYAGAGTYFSSLYLAEESNGDVEVTDPRKNPDWTFNWAGIGFRKSDTEFLQAFNEALAEYMGSPEMMENVAEYGYTESQLPGDITTEEVVQRLE